MILLQIRRTHRGPHLVKRVQGYDANNWQKRGNTKLHRELDSQYLRQSREKIGEIDRPHVVAGIDRPSTLSSGSAERQTADERGKDTLNELKTCLRKSLTGPKAASVHNAFKSAPEYPTGHTHASGWDTRFAVQRRRSSHPLCGRL